MNEKEKEDLIDRLTENVQVRIILGLDDPLDENLEEVMSIRDLFTDAVDRVLKKCYPHSYWIGSEGSYTTFQYFKSRERGVLGALKFIGDKAIGTLGQDYIIYNKIRGWGDEEGWQGEKLTELNTKPRDGIRHECSFAIGMAQKEHEYSHLEFTFIVNENSKEWDYAWEMLAKDDLNKGIKNPTVADNTGEAWQYMDTEYYAAQLHHCFRHRMHPKSHQREYVFIPVSKTFSRTKDCIN